MPGCQDFTSLGVIGVYLGYCPHTVTVYNRATIKGLIYLYYEYYPTVTEWGHHPKFTGLELDRGLKA